MSVLMIVETDPLIPSLPNRQLGNSSDSYSVLSGVNERWQEYSMNI